MSVRSIISLFIASILLPLNLLAITYISKLDFSFYEVNDEISLSQLRENLLFIYDLNYSDYELNFIYKNKECNLSYINNKLIMQPGTIIYLYDIDDFCFSIEDNCVFVNYVRNNEKYKRVIARSYSPNIDEFSNCLSDSELTDTSEE